MKKLFFTGIVFLMSLRGVVHADPLDLPDFWCATKSGANVTIYDGSKNNGISLGIKPGQYAIQSDLLPKSSASILISRTKTANKVIYKNTQITVTYFIGSANHEINYLGKTIPCYGQH